MVPPMPRRAAYGHTAALLLLLSGGCSPPWAMSLSGVHQLQPFTDRTVSPTIDRSGVHMRHCNSVVYVTCYATSGPTDDFRWSFESALNGKGGVSIRVTTTGYADRYLAPIVGSPDRVPAGVPPRHLITMDPKDAAAKGDLDIFSWEVEPGLCNSAFYSFRNQGANFKGRYLALSNKLDGPGCTEQYTAPASTLTLLLPSESQAQPSGATWMALDKDVMTGDVRSECGSSQWGIVVVVVLLICTLGYVLAGVALGHRSTGRWALRAHPHVRALAKS
jgi:hypothetical protein